VQVVGWRIDDPICLIGIFRGRSCDIFEDSRKGTHERVRRFSAKARLMMKYRNIEYTVLQGIERGVWKWTASVAGVVIMGQAAIKSKAVAAAEKAIDREPFCSGFRMRVSAAHRLRERTFLSSCISAHARPDEAAPGTPIHVSAAPPQRTGSFAV
jgi:hypothetical protein